MMSSPSLRQLDLFAQMVASGSFARCAADLGLPVETIERDMAALEARLGFRLFDRHGHEARLTEAGHKTAKAMSMLSDAMQPEALNPPPPANDASSVGSQAMLHRITLAAPPPVFVHFQEALAAFEEANGDIAITLDLDLQLADEARRRILSGRADIAYFYTLGEPDDFASRYVWSEPIALYVGTDNPLAKETGVTLADFARLPRLALDPRNGVRRLIEQALRSVGLSAGPPLLESDNLFDIMAELRASNGYFAAFGPMARDIGRMEGVRRAPLVDPLPKVDVRQAVRPDLDEDAVSRSLAEYLFL